VAFPAVAAVGGRLYVFGGQALTGPSAGQPVATIQVVNLATHAVTMAGRLPVPLAGATAVTLGGHVFVVGGDRGAGTTSGAVWAFDPSTLAVSTAGQLRVPVAHAGVAVVGASAWIVGGESNGAPVTAVQTLTR
jgi:N-acetylneuraminic acid mutarotase